MTAHVRRPARRRATALVVLAAALLGLGVGGTAALWRDAVGVDARLPLGGAVFGVGAPGEVRYATSGTTSLAHTFGPEEARTLRSAGAVAVPVQVDSLAQGNHGLTYTVEPSVDGGLFGLSTWSLTQVGSAQACTTSVTGESPRTSTPWDATYTDAVAPTTEYWCLVARWTPVSGTHEDTVTATGSATVPGVGDPVTVTGSDRWSATVTEDVDPADEPEHTLTFTFRTFRPGEQP
ncbi:hypothetical protein J1G44_00985 [Cellulomonas sp. zg-ZUI199]|uniref:Ribosomally synthesized peptide with SipW-like signal peptide n=1 Tax=Cellulomonas wangleii TaxID=2816956 RepID=A0ABX8D5W6_9CELL|nr:hypothetical protein [Cellulomonas wangleii]MBO0923058.1 hypothetical protein [Cellulomonas wangleii]QVI61442.1 hypothetical protein KG103_13270 [Cellulomonas wangleii]